MLIWQKTSYLALMLALSGWLSCMGLPLMAEASAARLAGQGQN